MATPVRDYDALVKSRRGIEVWRPVPSYEDIYEVSNLGRVRAVARIVTSPNRSTMVRKARARKLNFIGKKYLGLDLSKNGVTETWYVHRVVMLAFCGPLPAGMETRHLDNGINNALFNLKYGTSIENKADNKSKTQAAKSS
jgi:hypothetical protein